MTYADLLRDPRWQRKRLEVMELAGWRCEWCRDDSAELHVHHVRYVRGRAPWEYDATALRCLCTRCHAAQHPEKSGGLTPLSAIVPRLLERVQVVDRYDPELCVVCHASFRVDLTRCAACRHDAPLTVSGEDAA